MSDTQVGTSKTVSEPSAELLLKGECPLCKNTVSLTVGPIADDTHYFNIIPLIEGMIANPEVANNVLFMSLICPMDDTEIPITIGYLRAMRKTK